MRIPRLTIVTLTTALMLGAVAGSAGADPAFVPPWKVQVSLSPPYGPTGLPFSFSGIEVFSPENGNSETALGLQGEFGFLVNAILEPSMAVSVTRLELAPGANLTEFSLVPSLKLNYFTSPHVCLFAQPFAGIMIIDSNSTSTFSDVGIFGGLEGLVSSWGIRLFTGIEWTHGDFSSNNKNLISFPIRWALFAYF